MPNTQNITLVECFLDVRHCSGQWEIRDERDRQGKNKQGKCREQEFFKVLRVWWKLGSRTLPSTRKAFQKELDRLPRKEMHAREILHTFSEDSQPMYGFQFQKLSAETGEMVYDAGEPSRRRVWEVGGNVLQPDRYRQWYDWWARESKRAKRKSRWRDLAASEGLSQGRLLTRGTGGTWAGPVFFSLLSLFFFFTVYISFYKSNTCSVQKT